MKIYESFGGGVNSVAQKLLIIEWGWDTEAVFVDHGTDWPETYEYLDMFQGWLKDNGHKPIAVLVPEYARNKKSTVSYSNLYDYSHEYEMVPSFMIRWCSRLFKVAVVNRHVETPCFMLIGFDTDELGRTKFSCNKGIENRFPLLEAEMSRYDCKEYIKSHGLPVPQKSGCYICPYQSVYQWRELRHRHPDLFCKAEQLEQRNMDYRKRKGKKPLFLNQYPKASLRSIVDEDQYKLFKQDEYPPCECML